MPLEAGALLGHYRVLDALGHGGMGEVWLAEDTRLKRAVAIKTLPSHSPEAARGLRRLRREAEALAAVNHPNVVTVHAIEEVGELVFLVMERLEGETLDRMIPENGLPVPRLLELAAPIASALAAAHERGVVHGDLKPGNVMVTTDGRAKVLDFGLARIVSQQAGTVTTDTSTTITSAIRGTVPYMPLEQLAGEPADKRTDLYSLGAVLFEMATGRLPFPARTIAEQMLRMAAEPAPDVCAVRPALPAGLGVLVGSLLDRDPMARPANASGVADALRTPRRVPATRPAVAPVPARRAVNVEVVQLVARGRHLWNRRSEEGLRTSLACFQQAIDRDPLHAPAWIGVADALNMLTNYGFAHPDDTRPRVIAAVRKAIELAGDSADAFRARALAAWQSDFDWERADALYRQALELDPDDGLTHYWYAVLLAVTGRFDACMAELDRAESLDPLSLIVPAARGWFTLFAGQAERAHAMLRRVLTLDVGLYPAHWFLGQTLSALGRHGKAAESLGEAMRLGGRTMRLVGYTGYALGRDGRTEEARRLLAELHDWRQDHYVPPYFEALIHLGLHETEEALERLDTAVRSRDSMVRDLRSDPPWRDLRGEPRYHELLHTMGMAPLES
ncbi:MAG: serine/threonine-protein kinase [Gemmatimonadota bacterium]|jgi:tetratricopeptide (TPR) repeat protein